LDFLVLSLHVYLAHQVGLHEFDLVNFVFMWFCQLSWWTSWLSERSRSFAGRFPM